MISCCHSCVQRVAAVLLLFIFSTSCLLQAGPSSFPKQVEVEFSHTHEHGDEPHSHGPFTSASSEAHEPDANDAGDSHTHTILLTASAPLALPQKVELTFHTESNVAVNKIEESDPPADCFLSLIFRPPILA